VRRALDFEVGVALQPISEEAKTDLEGDELARERQEFLFLWCQEAAGGFKVNGGTFADSPFLRTAKNEFKDNEIGYFGQKYPSAVGILLQQTEANHVAHNLIHNGFYTGISVGWVWSYKRSISRDNVIEFNHIHHIGQGLLSDMGGIYTLGVSPGTVLRNNLIHDVDANRIFGYVLLLSGRIGALLGC
jgi:hypothetical protein